MSPRGERQGGNDERERVKLTALVPVPVKVEERACVNKNALYESCMCKIKIK